MNILIDRESERERENVSMYERRGGEIEGSVDRYIIYIYICVNQALLLPPVHLRLGQLQPYRCPVRQEYIRTSGLQVICNYLYLYMIIAIIIMFNVLSLLLLLLLLVILSSSICLPILLQILQMIIHLEELTLI